MSTMTAELDEAKTRLKAAPPEPATSPSAPPAEPAPERETAVSPRSYIVFRAGTIEELLGVEEAGSDTPDLWLKLGEVEARNGEAAMRQFSDDVPEGTTLGAVAAGRWTEKTTKVKVERSTELV